MRQRGLKRYVLLVEIDEGCDEFWEDVAKGSPRSKVRAEVQSCLADRGFVAPGCKVRMDEVRTIYRTR